MMSSDPMLVAAIDFGTTYSGWAFSFKRDFERDPIKISAKLWNNGQDVTSKAPTCALITPDGTTLDSFGFEAENKYADLAAEGKHEQWYFFKRFKIKLFDGIGISRDIKIEDANGRKFPAIKVFSLCIGYLKNDLIKMSGSRISEGGLANVDIHWVLTVPAIWNDAAKQVMREAAEATEVGIPQEKLTIALESEAAYLYCRHLPVDKFVGKDKMNIGSFKPGTKYLVLDAGGYTVDSTVYEVKNNDTLKELHKSSGGALGGTKVDEAFKQFLNTLFGARVIENFKDNRTDDYIELFREFELKKRDISPTEERIITLRFPASLPCLLSVQTGESLADAVKKGVYAKQIKIAGDKIRVDANVFKTFFDGPVKSIVSHVRNLLQQPAVRGCEAIVMVGGFSESPMLQGSIRKNFPRLKVIIPDEPCLAVLKGAVIYGHINSTYVEKVQEESVLGLSQASPKTHRPSNSEEPQEMYGNVDGANPAAEGLIEKGIVNTDEFGNTDLRYATAYLEALREGEETTNTIRVNIVGNAGVGKSSLTMNLLGMVPDRNIDSTDGIDRHVHKCCDAGDWSSKIVSSEARNAERIALSSVALQSKVLENEPPNGLSNMENKKSKDQSSHANLTNSDEHFDTKNIQEAEQLDQAQSLPVCDVTIQEQKTDRVIANTTFILQKNMKPEQDLLSDEGEKERIRTFSLKLNEKRCTSDKSIHIWDFGGQFIYYATHQLFHSRRAVYLLVFDARKDLNDIVETCEVTQSNDKDVKYFCKFWMQSIHSFVGNDKYEPPVILVATHTDTIPGWDEEKKDEFFDRIKDLFYETPVGRHIQEECFAVNNFSEDSSDVEALREYIVEVAQCQD